MYLTGDEFCHICGMLFESGDQWTYTYTVEYFNEKDGHIKRDYKLQWHKECYFELITKKGLQ